MKIAICAIVKNENIYLREWVEYHKGLGFDKIILYDNNPVDGEVPHNVIGDYIMDGFVEVHNVRGVPWRNYDIEGLKSWLQNRVYTRCIEEHRDEYKWIAFIDIDEFIVFGKNEPQNIHTIFEKYGYDAMGYEDLLMSWWVVGSDGKLNYHNYPVQMRFHDHVEIRDPNTGISDLWVKSIVRTDALRENNAMTAHILTDSYYCNEHGYWIKAEKEGYGNPQQVTLPSHDIIYVKHYVTKSLWEHLTRMRDGKDDPSMVGNRMDAYKMINGWSEDAETIFQKFKEYLNTPEQ